MTFMSSAAVINLYLYGQEKRPLNIAKEIFIREEEGVFTQIFKNVNDYMAGPGRFVNAANFELINKFMNPEITPELNGLTPGESYSKGQIQEKLGIKFIGISIQQWQYDDGKDEFIERAFLWNTSGFKIADGTDFIVNADGTREIRNFAIVPYAEKDKVTGLADYENFDFEGGDDLAYLTNLASEGVIDPSGIGRQVIVSFEGDPARTTLDLAAYQEAVATMPQPDLSLATRIPPEGLSYFQRLYDTGVIAFQQDGHHVEFGTLDNDSLVAGSTGNISDMMLPPLVIAGGGNDKVTGSFHGDELHGNGGSDTLRGGWGDDNIFGEGDNDRLYGEGGKDILSGAEGNDSVYGGDASDALMGYAGNDVLDGEDGDDDLLGGSGDDQLVGSSGNDKIFGEEGSDTLYGGFGNDVLQGGSAYDTYIVTSSEGVDTITDATGRLLLDGTQLSGGVHIKDTDLYKSRDGTHVYQWSGGDLFIDNAILVTGFRNHDLGIYLEREKERQESTAPITSNYWDAINTQSPLVLDLDGDGIKTVGRSNGAFFDFDGTGRRTLTGWVNASDGLLVLDRNGNGLIDDGSELFGNNGDIPAPNGFAALAQLDNNKDGKISGSDERWRDLQVWRDLNGDGYTNPAELISLARAGIGSIYLAYTEYTGLDDYQNFMLQFGKYETTSGEMRDVTDVWFSVDTATVIAKDVEPITADVAMLPDVLGMGRVEDLRHAVMHDMSGTLEAALKEFSNEPNIIERNALLDKILEIWSGAINISEGGRGPWFSAQKLGILEKFMGSDYYQWDNRYPANPGINAREELTLAYTKLHEYYYSKISAQTIYSSYYEEILYSRDPVSHQLVADLLPVVPLLKTLIAKSLGEGSLILADFVRTILGAPPVSSPDLVEFKSAFTDQVQEVQRVLATVMSGFFVTNDRDIMKGGEANDVMAGREGDDILSSGNGNDTIDGGAGDDRIDAAAGADIIYFGRGDGVDTVLFQDYDSSKMDENNNDTLRFLEGIRPEDVILRLRENDEASDQIDLLITIANGTDGLILGKWTRAEYRVDRMEFFDGTAWDLQAILNQVARPTMGADILTGSSDADILVALGGDDTVYGADGNDLINGGDGNDKLRGQAGGDTLQGGVGDDDMQGGVGDDTFLFNRGDGSDVIRVDDYEYWNPPGPNNDVIRFGSGINANDIELSRDRENLYLTLRDSSDRVTLHNWSTSWARIAYVEFEDGTTWNAEYLAAHSNVATVGNDYIEGTAGADVLAGLLGDDLLFGYEGDDFFDGGRGDDELFGGKGIDTYQFGRGDGQDVIYGDAWPEISQGDIIRFKEGIGIDEVHMRQQDADLVITVGTNDSDILRLVEWFGGGVEISSGEQVDSIVFYDGTVWGRDTIFALATAPSDGDDQVRGTQEDDRLFGLSGSDHLDALDGDDTLIGGIGDDYLEGGSGADTYVFSTGDGNDRISDWDSTPETQDVIVFGNDIRPGDISLSKDFGGSLCLTNLISGDSIAISFWDEVESAIELVKFDDGTVWDLPTITIGVGMPLADQSAVML